MSALYFASGCCLTAAVTMTSMASREWMWMLVPAAACMVGAVIFEFNKR